MKKTKSKYFLSRSLLFGSGMSLMLKESANDTWIAIIIGFLIGTSIIYTFNKLKFSDKSKVTFIPELILSFLLIYTLLNNLVTFINSYYLIYTSGIFITLSFLLLVGYLTNKKDIVLERLSNILFIISIITIILESILLLPDVDFSNVLPIYSTNASSIIKSSIIYALLSTTPLMISKKSNLKEDLKIYSISTVTTIISTILIIGVFGESLSSSFNYPEYAILREINALNFIQNIESVLALKYLADIFISVSMASKKVKETLNYSKNIITYIIFILITILIYFTNLNIKNFLDNYIYLLLGGILLILIPILSIKKALFKSSAK